jgi:predicted permease
VTWWQRVRGGDRIERELDAEVRDHFERHVSALVHTGISEPEARRRARLEFGGLEQVKEACRDVRPASWTSDLARDFRFAARLFAKHRLPALAIVVTLAAALGLNASVFAVAAATVIHPFTFPHLDRLVVVSERSLDDPDIASGAAFTSPANFLDWKRRTSALDALAAMSLRDVELGQRAEPERLRAAGVSPELFDVLGVRPALGRSFDSETLQGNHRRVILSNELWHRLFGGDATMIGRSIMLDGELFDVVGIAPPKVDFPFGTELWTPLALDRDAPGRRDERTLTVIGRLKEGVTIAAAQADMDIVGGDLARRYPDDNGRRGIRIETLTAGLTEEGVGAMYALMQASALFVLFIACANIANLLLALGLERQREIAVRIALGASRARVIRAMLVESVALAICAMPLAVAVCGAALRVLIFMMPPRLAAAVPGWNSIGVDAPLVAFTATLAVGSVILFGLAPALHNSRQHPDSLKEAARMTAGSGRQRLRRALIAAQVSLALPLLVAAALSWRGTIRLLHGPQGFTPEKILTAGVNLPERVFRDGDAERRFVDAVLEQAASQPGIRAAAIANNLPSTGWNTAERIAVEGRTIDVDGPPAVDLRVVSPAFFDTMGIRVAAGRQFSVDDRAGTQPVAIVSRSMAESFWPGLDALGQHLRNAEVPDAPSVTIVGVVDDVIQDWFWGRNMPTLYRPYAQEPVRDFAIAVRTEGDPAAATGALSAAIHAVDSTRPLLDVRTMDQIIRERMAAPLQVATLMAVLGALALVLAAVGLYGVIAYLVSQRTHEIGLRLALGASRRDIFRLVFAQAAEVTLAGVATGAALAAISARLLEAALQGIVSLDFRFLIAAVSVVAAVAVCAAYIPARRALGIDPAIALRNE